LVPIFFIHFKISSFDKYLVMTMQILAVIPARGGSKGLPGKNTRDLDGMPLIAYSISAAIQSKLVNRIICTTDSEEIASIARRHGAETPFIRPKELAADNSTDLDVFLHLLEWLNRKEFYVPDVVVQLRPTSPLRPVTLVDQGINKIIKNQSIDSIRTVCPAPNTPFKMWTISASEDRLKALIQVKGIPEPYNAPRQSLPEVWWQAGLLDVIRTRVITQEKSMSGHHISFIKVDPVFAVDIDTIDDFNTAESLVRRLECVRP
jgi:CMP-N,N'-diacetyllegionaminic acid synthase